MILTEAQKTEVVLRVRQAIRKLPPELRKGKRYPYLRLVAKLVKGRDG